MCGVEYKGTEYGGRYALVTSLAASGLSMAQIQQNWTQHSTLAAVQAYYDASLLDDTEQNEQDQFRQWSSENGRNGSSSKESATVDIIQKYETVRGKSSAVDRESCHAVRSVSRTGQTARRRPKQNEFE